MRHVISCYNLRQGMQYVHRLKDVQPGDCLFVTERTGSENLEGLDARDLAIHRVEGQRLPYFAFERLRQSCHRRELAIADLFKKGNEWPRRP